MNFIELVKERYAVKEFEGRKISEEDLNKIVEIIRLAPSSFNLQSWKIKIVEDVKVLGELEKASYGQKQIGTASHLLVFCSISDFDLQLEKILKSMKDEGVPEEKLEAYSKVVRDYFGYTSKEDLVKMSERELFLAVENVLLYATELGFGSCPMGGFEIAKYKKILNIPEGLNPVVVVPIGYPIDSAKKKIRLGRKDIVF